MNMAVRLPTESETTAHKKRRAFQDKIAAKAAELAAIAALGPEAMPAETDPPKQKHWFSIVGMEPAAHPSIAQIQDAVADHYSVSRADICSQRRQKDVVLPRQIAVYLCRELTPFSLPAIGRKFGGRDHTTALSSVRKITRLVYSDRDMALDVATLTEALTAR